MTIVNVTHLVISVRSSANVLPTAIIDSLDVGAKLIAIQNNVPATSLFENVTPISVL